MKVLFEDMAFEKMFSYARASSGEITGFGYVDRVGKDLVVKDTFLIPQQVNSAYCEASQLVRWATSNPKQASKARLWWHSHCNMSVFMSGTDVATAKRLSQVMPYLLTAVVNKQSQILLQAYVNKPIPHVIDNLECETVFERNMNRVDDICKADCKQMVREIKVKKPVYKKPEPGIVEVGEDELPFWMQKYQEQEREYGKKNRPEEERRLPTLTEDQEEEMRRIYADEI